MKIILFANTDWYLYNFRLALALALKESGCEVLLLAPEGAYSKKLQELGFRFAAVSLSRRSLNPLRELVLLYRLWQLFRREKPDVVHGFTIKCAVYGALVAKVAGVVGRVSSVAGMGYVFVSQDIRARLLRPFVRFLLRYSIARGNAKVIVQNRDDMDVFLNTLLVDENHLSLIRGSGVDCVKFSHRQRSVNEGVLRAVLPARLLWDKGVGEFVEAASLLRDEGRNIQMLIAGAPDPGNPSSIAGSQVDAWKESGVVQILGHMEDMPKLFNSVDVVVLPSYREGLPRGLIEGGACGCALIATDVPGCREVIDSHGQNGLLVHPRDPQSLARAIAILDDDRKLLMSLGSAARRRVVECFSDDRVIAATIVIYGELLGRPQLN